MTLLLLIACASTTPAPAPVPWPVEAPRPPLPPEPEAPEVSYDETKANAEATRAALAKRFAEAVSPTDRQAVRDEAAERLRAMLLDEIFPHWYGTDWAFEGTTEVPREGHIACGYFVSTTLRDVGLQVERVRMAQQASEHIIETLVPPADIQRYRDRPLAEVLDDLAASPDALYLVGLDFHVGYLSRRDGTTRFCHASFISTAEHYAEMVCEDAASSPALASAYRVTGRLMADSMVDAWLTGAPIPTVTR